MSGDVYISANITAHYSHLLVNRTKLIFSYSTKRTNPIIGYIFECCSRCNTIIWVSYGGIIHPSAHITYILFHNSIVLNETYNDHSIPVVSICKYTINKLNEV